MKLVNTIELLAVAGGLHLAHHGDDKHAEGEKARPEEVENKVSNAFADLTGNEHHHHKPT